MGLSSETINVGGQAVLEGVMMRSPKALAVAVRKPDGEVAIKEAPWRSISDRYPVLGRPFLRGVVVLIESLVNGIDALTFSANQALDGEMEEEPGPIEVAGLAGLAVAAAALAFYFLPVWVAQIIGLAALAAAYIDWADLWPGFLKKEKTKNDAPLGFFALAGTIGFSFGLGVLLFVVLPHYLSLLLGRLGPLSFGVDSLAFHLVDGVIKLAVFILYIWLISLIKDIARVFEYHGAEHKSIFAYESGCDLTLENARSFSTLHPRCGTSFILVVLMISILLFAVVFPFITPEGESVGWTTHLFFVGIKILLLFPIAGLAYEINRYAGRHMDNPLLKAAILPGLLVQKITTREPSDDQIEIALIALKKALAIEEEQAAPVKCSKT